MTSNLHQIVQKIDWELLRRQKSWLFRHPPKHSPKQSATGLISLIDAIQDAAFLDQIADRETIFGKPLTKGTPHDC